MVGIFWRFSGHARPHRSSFLDRKEPEATERDAEVETKLDSEGNVVVEFDADFKPIEHPPEPSDDDQPAECPIPDSSFWNNEGIWKELESLQKRTESLIGNEESTVEHLHGQAVYKRHHTLSEDSPLLPSLGGPENHISLVFQHRKQFES